jgi:hypothetical protein
MKRNRRYLDTIFGARLQIDPGVPPVLASLATEAETSGGLLFSITPDRADQVLPAFAKAGEECWEIGTVIPEPLIRLLP